MKFRGCSAIVALGVTAQATLPCAGIFRDGQKAVIASEQALIVWQPDTQTQTFIRSANFKGKGADFGFIVPSPTEPQLSEVDEKLFTTLRTTVSSRYRGSGATKSASPGLGGAGGGVQVVKEQTVSGMKATVLKATDAKALKAWLAGNGYPSDPSVIRWTEYYVRNNFYLTAFKIDRKPGNEQVQTSPMKMVFVTSKPFYPYREPATKSGQKGRGLNVFFLAPWKAHASYAKTNRKWEAHPLEVSNLKEKEIQTIFDQAQLKPNERPKNPVLSLFLDRNEIRPDEDVVFNRSIAF